MSSRLEQAWQTYVSGENSAFGEVYETFHPTLTLYCLGIVKDMEEAKNIASDSLVKLLENEDAETIRNVQSWLFTVARNACNTHYTQNLRRGQILENLQGYFRRTDRNDGGVRLEEESIEAKLVSLFSEDELKIWNLHQEGYDNVEIATKLDMNEKTVANRKSIARKKLLKSITDGG
jgi:RNA polymerase sigma factor (sigma-70 family)